jgi:hypothetical protein
MMCLDVGFAWDSSRFTDLWEFFFYCFLTNLFSPLYHMCGITCMSDLVTVTQVTDALATVLSVPLHLGQSHCSALYFTDLFFCSDCSCSSYLVHLSFQIVCVSSTLILLNTPCLSSQCNVFLFILEHLQYMCNHDFSVFVSKFHHLSFLLLGSFWVVRESDFASQ